MLDRLQELVRATKDGQLRAPGPKQKLRSKTASKKQEDGLKRMLLGPVAQVVRNKGENKGQPHKQKPDGNGGKRDALRLEPTCWQVTIWAVVSPQSYRKLYRVSLLLRPNGT